MDNKLIYSESYFLTAGETDARGEMPPTLIVERMIEIATAHANRLDIGYGRLSPLGRAWVLVGLTYCMARPVVINETYRITTWIESTNRFFSERCFRIDDADGVAIGYGRSSWAIIDTTARRTVNLDFLDFDTLRTEGMDCVAAEIRSMPAIDEADHTEVYAFRYMDLDFNGHVNSTRYVEHILNCWPLEHYRRHWVEAFAIGYRRECLFGDEVQIQISDEAEVSRVDVIRGGERAVTARIGWSDAKS